MGADSAPGVNCAESDDCQPCPLDCFEVSVRRANIKNQIPQSKIQYGNNNQ